MIKRILVGLGGTPFTPTAIRYAVELAQVHQAEIVGVTVIDRRRLGALTKAAGAAQDAIKEFKRLEDAGNRQEQAIVDLESACADEGIRCAVSRESGDPFERMISQARYFDLMLFGLRSLFDYGFLKTDSSDVLTRLVSRGVQPILAVSQEWRPIRRVLMTYSGSMESAKAIKRFIHMQLWSDLSIKVVTFGQSPNDTRELLTNVADYCRAYGYDAEVEHVTGSSRQLLIQHAADWQADLIVLGNSAKHYWLKKLLGETAMHVIRNANVPLFLSQ